MMRCCPLQQAYWCRTRYCRICCNMVYSRKGMEAYCECRTDRFLSFVPPVRYRICGTYFSFCHCDDQRCNATNCYRHRIMVEDSDKAIAVLLKKKEEAIKANNRMANVCRRTGSGDRDKWYKYTHPE